MKRQIVSNAIPEGSIVTLAFDTERLGSPASFFLPIEIGISVVGEYPSMEEYDSFSYSEYRSEKEHEKSFPTEKRCMDEFWSKNRETLDSIENSTDKRINVEESRSLMINAAVQFVKKWEKKASDENFKLVIVSDNKICDPTSINVMIERYMDADHPQLPYSFAFPGKYNTIVETDSVILGILFTFVDKNYVENPSGLEKALEKHFMFELPNVTHNHRAASDARYIASYYQVCLGIATGQITKKDVQPEETF